MPENDFIGDWLPIKKTLEGLYTLLPIVQTPSVLMTVRFLSLENHQVKSHLDNFMSKMIQKIKNLELNQNIITEK